VQQEEGNELSRINDAISQVKQQLGNLQQRFSERPTAWTSSAPNSSLAPIPEYSATLSNNYKRPKHKK
jgi:hypothetical protein